MKKIKAIIEGNDSKMGRTFDIFIQILIILSIINFSLETLPNLNSEQRSVLWAMQVFTVSVFTLEYILRLIVADKPLRFVFSFYGIIDLLAILPFYITTGIDLRSIRIFRLFRLFRLFKVVRYTKALHRFKHAFIEIKNELTIFFLASLFLLYISGVGIYHFENPAQPDKFQSVFDGLWWGLATLTTVGFGDIYPITPGGKLFSFFILMIGLGIVAVPAGLIASSM